MREKKLRSTASNGKGESSDVRFISIEQPSSIDTIDGASDATKLKQDDGRSGSHPAVLRLACVLGRSAARADLRARRRGSVSVMGLPETLLVVAAMICALLWNGLAGVH